MSQSISGKGFMKPDIPHGTHGIYSRGTLCTPSNMDIVEIPRKGKVSVMWHQTIILDGHHRLDPMGFFLMIDTMSSQGFLDGVLSSEQSFGLLIIQQFVLCGSIFCYISFKSPKTKLQNMALHSASSNQVPFKYILDPVP
jgi:hypothetical protein